jgi:hypothetical protein
MTVPEHRKQGLPVSALRRGRPAHRAIAAMMITLLASGLVASCGSGPPPPSTPPAGVQTFTGLARDHVQGHVNYPQNPPVGGAHSAMWLNCGIYRTPVPNENAVHAMEHGAVWITYRPDLPADQVSILRQRVDKKTYVVLSPYPGLPAPVVASAWGAQLAMPSASDPRLAQFLDYYRQGPQTPEPGAPCTGGAGNPQ